MEQLKDKSKTSNSRQKQEKALNKMIAKNPNINYLISVLDLKLKQQIQNL
jgi:hypothetical protein